MKVDVENGLQRVVKAIGEGLLSLPGIATVTSDPLHEPSASDLPLARLTWLDRNAGYLGNPLFVSLSEAVSTTYGYAPKRAGSHTGASGQSIVDASGDFAGGDGPVVEGDAVRNLTTGETGSVMSVESGTEVVTDIAFSDGDEYEIHWPVDVLEYHVLDHKATLEIDIMTFPHATVESGQRLDQLELDVQRWLWGDGQEALQEQNVEIVDVSHVSPASGPTETGLGSDRYKRSILEVEMNVGEGVTVRQRTTESVPAPYNTNPDPPPAGGFVDTCDEIGGGE